MTRSHPLQRDQARDRVATVTAVLGATGVLGAAVLVVALPTVSARAAQPAAPTAEAAVPTTQQQGPWAGRAGGLRSGTGQQPQGRSAAS